MNPIDDNSLPPFIQLSDNRVDFISDLPLELATEIVTFVFDNSTLLSPYDRCPYLYVPRKWRQRILGRNDLHFDIYRCSSPEPYRSSELAKFAPHVKSLGFEIGINGPLHDSNALDFNSTHFPNLKHLQIEYFMPNDDRLIFILKSIGTNLTDLHLYTEGWMSPQCIHLSRILDMCRKLVYVSLGTTKVDLLTNQYPNITHFTLRIYENDLPITTIENLHSHLPSAVVFDVSTLPEPAGVSDEELPYDMYIDADVEQSDEELPYDMYIDADVEQSDEEFPYEMFIDWDEEQFDEE